LIWFTAGAGLWKYLCSVQAQKCPNKVVYYTSAHECIKFQSSVAYTGVCRFKLPGLIEIQQLNFVVSSLFPKGGELSATIRDTPYQVIRRMPVDGKVVQVNEILLPGNFNTVVKHGESPGGWIALSRHRNLSKEAGSCFLNIPDEC
jgi:hypothetical protein